MKRLIISLLAFHSSDGREGTSEKIATLSIVPRSNATHIFWKSIDLGSVTTDQESSFFRRQSEGTNANEYQVQTLQDAQAECLQFLQDNIMSFDLPFQETLGFPTENDETNTDGLGNGLIGPTIEMALQAKVAFPWTDALPKEIFMEYVLNYANLNEARTNWRPLLVDALRFNQSDLWLSGDANLTSVVTWVNQQLWTKLSRNPDNPIFFKPSQTPLIFDPMSIIAFGYASCTGTSIFFANALRAVGVPARVVGTPAWFGDRSQGNHNWVEVYDIDSDGRGEWKFLEPSPANAGLDTLDKDPCDRWFCKASRYPSSRVYAARLRKHSGSEAAIYFPLTWEWRNQAVPGEDRTQYYTDVCGNCEKE